MNEYVIRNGVRATEIQQMYGVNNEISTYLKDEFGNAGYLKILRPSGNVRIIARKRTLNGRKISVPLEISVHKGKPIEQ